IEPKIKGLLNKLSSVNFDSISNQIWDIAKESNTTLKTVVRMIFHKACDEPTFATNWAKLCKKLHDTLSTYPDASTIQDPTIMKKGNNNNNDNDEQQPASGIYLYRCYLLNKCQEQFELGWSTDVETMEMFSDAYYACMKQKRQGLGLVVFIGELYKQDMLLSRTVCQCLSRLIKEKEKVTDEDLETVCKLLMTVGPSFDTSYQTKFWLNIYIKRLEDVTKDNKNLSTRVKFKVMVCITHLYFF
ncbi:armadillo-type protein, partial [Phascolomyces articulosus]